MGTLDAEKAYGWDNISIKMIKICGNPIVLSLIFEATFKEKNSHIYGKKQMWFLSIKKKKKNIKKLLPY